MGDSNKPSDNASLNSSRGESDGLIVRSENTTAAEGLLSLATPEEDTVADEPERSSKTDGKPQQPMDGPRNSFDKTLSSSDDNMAETHLKPTVCAVDTVLAKTPSDESTSKNNRLYAASLDVGSFTENEEAETDRKAAKLQSEISSQNSSPKVSKFKKLFEGLSRSEKEEVALMLLSKENYDDYKGIRNIENDKTNNCESKEEEIEILEDDNDSKPSAIINDKSKIDDKESDKEESKNMSSYLSRKNDSPKRPSTILTSKSKPQQKKLKTVNDKDITIEYESTDDDIIEVYSMNDDGRKLFVGDREQTIMRDFVQNVGLFFRKDPDYDGQGLTWEKLDWQHKLIKPFSDFKNSVKNRRLMSIIYVSKWNSKFEEINRNFLKATIVHLSKRDIDLFSYLPQFVGEYKSNNRDWGVVRNSKDERGNKLPDEFQGKLPYYQFEGTGLKNRLAKGKKTAQKMGVPEDKIQVIMDDLDNILLNLVKTAFDQRGINFDPKKATISASYLWTMQHFIQHPHFDNKIKKIEDEAYIQNFYLAELALSESGSYLQVWNSKAYGAPGHLLHLPQGVFTLLPGNTLHGGGFKGNTNGNPRMHLYIFLNNRRHTSNNKGEPVYYPDVAPYPNAEVLKNGRANILFHCPKPGPEPKPKKKIVKKAKLGNRKFLIHKRKNMKNVSPNEKSKARKRGKTA